MSTFNKNRYYLLFFVLLMLLTLALTSCGSTSALPLASLRPDSCPDASVDFDDLEIVYGQNELTFTFYVPPI
jgi:hypothetical protein